MIEKITNNKISLTLPTVFGEELTFLEFCGKMRSKLNECIGVVNKNTTDIQQNTANIQQNATAISRNESDIVKLNGVVNSISVQADENTEEILNRKIESLFAPVILNVESHESGVDINASVYIRLGRIDWQGLGCLYAKVNISFSGNTDAKTLKINSIQFGTRKAANIDSVSTSFTAKTDVINIPIYLTGSSDTPVGTSDITVTGINLLGMSIVAESLASSFTLNGIPTGIDIPCESLTFTSPGGSEQDPKIFYTLIAVEGHMDIFTVSAGIPAVSERAYLHTDFADVISKSNIHTQFLCQGGYYDSNTISNVSDNGASLGAALINYTEFTESSHMYTARTTVITEHNGGSPNLLKKTGNALMDIPYGQSAHISLRFDLFN